MNTANDRAHMSLEQKRALLRKLLKQRRQVSEFPLSYAQERLWFLDQLVPGNPFYNIDAVIRLRGPLHRDALTHAIGEVVKRHDSLRTTFRSGPEHPLQVVHADIVHQTDFLELSADTEQERTHEALRLAHGEAGNPFDLLNGPLVRSTLLQLGDDDHILLLTMHHIVADGWSMGILINEISKLYTAFRNGKPSPLPALSIQYPDYAVWQRRQLDGVGIDAQLAWWRRKLTGLPVLALPTDRGRPAIASFRGARHYFTFPSEITTALRTLSQASGATLFITLLSAFAVLLYRHSGDTDIVIGSPVAGRTRTELETLIGFFVNTLVLRIDLGGDPDFIELVKRVREVSLDAFSHQDLPFEKLVEDLQPDRDLARNPLCQVVFALQNAPSTILDLPGLAVSYPVLGNETTKFDLTLDIWESGDRLGARFEYSTDLFDAATITRMAGHLVTLVADGVHNPGHRVSAMTMLRPDERTLLIDAWNHSAVDYPQECVPATITAVAEKIPDGIALCDDTSCMPYAELESGANRIAHFLLTQGIGSGCVIGILLPSSALLYQAALGIMRTGAAYLPMDPSTPAFRVGLFMTEAGAEHLLTDSSLDEFGTTPEIAIHQLDSLDLQAAPSSAPSVTLNPEQPAYVIFTSGSTGRPKGVAVPHRALTNLCAWHRRVYRIEATDRASLIASPAFDASVWETWPYLCAGASLHIPAAELRMSPPALIKWLADQAITYSFMPTPLAELVLDQRSVKTLQLRALLIGGAKLHHAPETGLPFPVINHYGPTEYGVVATAGEVSPAHSAIPPIGRPIDNTRAYILDPHYQPVPIGVAGELFLTGAGLAVGYLGRPGASTERFVPCPFTAGARMYRTGDRVKYLANGEIVFLERLDDQLKIRGFRVEPGEIESELGSHPAVKEVAVAPVGDGDQKQLAAFVVRRTDTVDVDDSDERVSMWRTLYDQTFAQAADTGDTADFTGWNDSCTGAPIPLEQMTEWLEETLRRIPVNPRSRVLEIGCGTGLLSLRLAGIAASYHGTDFSARVLQRIERRARAAGLEDLVLEQREANDFGGIAPSHYDTIILNSIVQYFPGTAYLAQVIEAAATCAAPGATLFIGDVRSYPLLEAFHTFVQLARADNDTSVAELRSRIVAAVAQEQELLLDPRFFFALGEQMQRNVRVRILPKQGQRLSEMVRFRYDVLITLDTEPDQTPARSLDWRRDHLDQTLVHHILADETPASLLVTGIPNAHTEPIARVVDRLNEQAPPDVANLRVTMRSEQGLAPSVWSTFDAPGYDLDLSWFEMDSRGAYAVIFRRKTKPAVTPLREIHALSGDWSDYANDPLSGVAAQTLIPQLKHHLTQRLPDYMVPPSFILLDRLPHTLSGKIDRQALSASHHRRTTDLRFIPPRDQLEEVIAEIWQRLLNVDQVGRGDNFFSLGGHSLLATRLISHLRDALDVEIPVRTIFEAPTVSGLAQFMRLTETDHKRLLHDAGVWLMVSHMPETKAADMLAARERT